MAGQALGGADQQTVGEAALAWRQALTAGENVGVTASDSLLLATAAQHGLILVNRNLPDTQGLDVQVVNPWDA